MKSILVLVTGDFGVGKDTIVDMLVKMLGSDNATKIKSWTTRNKRYSQKDDTHQFFLPADPLEKRNEYFEKHILNSDRLVAYTKIGGAYYWTELSQFGKRPIEFYIIDSKGVVDVFKKGFPVKKVILKIERPDNLISVDKKRLHRERHFDAEDFSLYFDSVITIQNKSETLEELWYDLKPFAQTLDALKEKPFYE